MAQSAAHHQSLISKKHLSTLTGRDEEPYIDIVDTSGRVMRVIVKKWGNSASVRIPAAVMQAAQLQLDQAVDVREEAGRIVIEPIPPEDCDLAALIAAITPENLHESIDFGAPMGKEVW